ncbi:MAG TPA: helix-turn-helix domain-containing protein [Gemmataceae bacterium]|jgi:excisionase family DNA binding protein
MARPKHKPEAASGTPRSTVAKKISAEVLTLSEVATYLRLAEADVLRLVDEQALPARRLGKEWRFLKDAIQDWLRTGPQPKSNKEALMELAGAWKDDPYIEQELAEIYRRRGRPLTEDES